ncbi:MAG: M24 family metallopeptidase [Verrucomicrobiota bacterium]
MIKDPSEIPIMKQACEITEAGFRRVLQFIQPGVGEWEIEAEFLHEFVRRRSKGFAYSPIIGSGKNSCVLHYLDNDSICQDGELVLMDVAAEYANWNADMTRTVPVNGRFSERQKEVYRAVLSVMRYAASILRPDITLLDYQRRVLLSMEEQLIRLGLIDSEDAKKQDRDELPLVKKYFMHGTSHHLGLDVHDVSLPYTSVQEGMVFTVEPGIYIREEKLGIRLENNYLIGPTGNHDLMESIPIEIEEIEGLMAS